MGKASISIAISGSYNGSAVERAEKSLDRLAVKTAAAEGSISKSWVEAGSKTAELGGRIYNLGDSMESVGGTLTRSLTVQLAAAGAGAIAAAADFDAAGARIDAACGDATEGAETLKAVGSTLYKDGWGESMDAIASSAIRAREILGDLSQTDMSYAIKGAMTLEQAYGSDFSESLRGVNVLMDKFGLSATEATDLMVSGTQRGLDYTKELGDNLSEYSGRWADAGMTASQYFSLLEAGAQDGAYQLDKVGDFLNEFLTSLSDGRMEEGIGHFSQGTRATFESFKEGGASAQGVLDAVIGELAAMPGEYAKAQIASELWSSLGEDNAMSMITALAGVDDTFTNVGGAAQDAGDKISDNLANKATSALRTAQEAALPFASVAVDVLGGVAETAKGSAEGFSNLDEGTQNMIVSAGLLAAAAGPVLSIGGRIAKGVGSIVTVFGRARQGVAVYADALTTTNVASLKAYQGNDKLAKALEKNPAVKAAGGVQKYIDAVTDANAAQGRYSSSLKKLEREQSKGSKANAEVVESLQKEVSERKSAADAAKGTVDGYKASAAAAKTSTAAVAAQSVAMKAASVAAATLKAVMATAIPMIAITAITALVDNYNEAAEKSRTLDAATDGLVEATSQVPSAADGAGEALKEYSVSAEQSRSTVDAAIESQAQLAESIRETNVDASGQMGQLQSAYATIQEYANQSDLTGEAQARLKAAVETVNSMCGTQISVTDSVNGRLSDENGAIEDVTASIGEYIDQKMQQIRLEAQQENLEALYKQQADNIAAMTEATAAYNAELGDHDSYVESWIESNRAQADVYAEMGLSMEQAAESAWDVHEAEVAQKTGLNDAREAVEANTTAINNLESSYAATAAAADSSSTSLQSFVASSPKYTAALTQMGYDATSFAASLEGAGVSVADLRSLSDDELSMLVASWDGSSQSIIDAMDSMGYEMGDAGLNAATALSNGIASGTVDVETATAVLRAAASGDWSSVASKMSAAGMSIPQSVAGGISSNGFVASDAASQMMSIVALQLTGGDVTAAAELLGHDIDAGLAEGILNGTLSDEASAQLGQDVIDAAKASLESHSPSQAMARVGEDVDAGLAQGIRGGEDGPIGAIERLGASLLDAISPLPGQAGKTGSSASGSLSSGLASGISSVGSSAARLASSAASGVSGTPSRLLGLGRSASGSYASGVGSGVFATSSSASRLASAAAGMKNSGDSYGWGSHLAGNFASGLLSGVGSVASAALSLVASAKAKMGFSVPEEGPWSGSERGGETSGLHLAQNFARGMLSGIPAVSSAAGALMRSASITGSSSYVSTAGQSHDAPIVLLERLIEEVRALRSELGPTIADYAPRFPTDRQAKRKVQEWTR